MAGAAICSAFVSICVHRSGRFQVGKKATKVEIQHRVDRVARLLINCASRSEVAEYAHREWGVGKAQADIYINRARLQIREDYSIERADFIATRLGTLDKVVKQALKQDQLNAVIGALRLQADLTIGNYVNK